MNDLEKSLVAMVESRIEQAKKGDELALASLRITMQGKDGFDFDIASPAFVIMAAEKYVKTLKRRDSEKEYSRFYCERDNDLGCWMMFQRLATPEGSDRMICAMDSALWCEAITEWANTLERLPVFDSEVTHPPAE